MTAHHQWGEVLWWIVDHVHRLLQPVVTDVPTVNVSPWRNAYSIVSKADDLLYYLEGTLSRFCRHDVVLDFRDSSFECVSNYVVNDDWWVNKSRTADTAQSNFHCTRWWLPLYNTNYLSTNRTLRFHYFERMMDTITMKNVIANIKTYNRRLRQFFVTNYTVIIFRKGWLGKCASRNTLRKVVGGVIMKNSNLKWRIIIGRYISKSLLVGT